MSHLLQFIAELLLSGGGPSKDSVLPRIFAVVTMSLAGICFLGFAGFAFVTIRPIIGIPAGLFFIAFSALCFWLVRRAVRS